MTVVMFEPHADDVVLFACYTLLHEQTVGSDVRVITVFSEDNQRADETVAAMDVLAVEDWRGWLDIPKQPFAVANRMLELDDSEMTVWVPMVELGGHEDHDLVGRIAQQVFGNRCRFYATYKRGYGRTRTDHEVTPEPGWYATKFEAMACYTSQINDPQMRPWFSEWDREFVQ